MKKSILFILLIAGASALFAQRPNRGSVGLELSGVYYLGDLNKVPFSQMSYSGGAFYRHAIDSRFLISGTASYINIKAKGELYDFAGKQDFNYNAFDASGKVEFNFIPFIIGDDKYTQTPYAFIGLGAAYYTNSQVPILVSIPFGIGYKYNLTERFLIGGSYTMRKTFTDKLDYLPIEVSGSTKQNNYFGNSDWFSLLGIYLAYKINYRMKCPAFD